MEIQVNEMGNRIKMRRKELNIKQYQLAEFLDISNNHMSSIENGTQKPSLDVFIKICTALGVSPNYLLMGSLHPQDVPLDIYDDLSLCSSEDIILARAMVKILVERNKKYT